MHLDFSTMNEKEIKVFSNNIIILMDLVKNTILIKKKKKLIKENLI